MKIEFGEFQFAIAIINEITNLHAKRGKKISFYAPSPYEEATLGYDVKFDKCVPIFIQFKRPEYLFNKSAKHEKAGDFSVPYFRFDLYTNISRKSKTFKSPILNSQHNILVALSKIEKCVFYCSPKFHTLFEFDELYKTNSVIKNSFFLRINKLPEFRINGDHEVVYNINNNFKHFSKASELLFEETKFDHIEEYLNDNDYKNFNSVIENVLSILKTENNKQDLIIETPQQLQQKLNSLGMFLILATK